MNKHFNASKHWKLTLVRSATGRHPKHRATLKALGLRRIRQSNTVPCNNASFGMIRLVSYLIRIEEI